MALHEAVTQSKEAVEMCLQEGCSIDERDPLDRTPLFCAAELGRRDIMKFLIDKGANVNADTWGLTPLLWAAERGKMDIMKILIDKGANVNATDTDGFTPLLWTAGRGDIDIMKILIEKGANVNATETDTSCTPLLYAAARGKMDNMKFLIDKGANVNAIGANGRNILQMMIQNHRGNVGMCEMAEALFEAGLYVHHKSKKSTPMHDIITVMYSYPAITASEISRLIILFELCLRKGADPNAVCDEHKGSLLAHAVRMAHETSSHLRLLICVLFIKLIAEYGGDVSQPVAIPGRQRDLFAFEIFISHYPVQIDYATLRQLSCPKAFVACPHNIFCIPAENLTIRAFHRLLNLGYIYYGCIQSLSDPTRGADVNQKLQDFLTFLNTKGLSEESLSEMLKDVSPSNFGVLEDTPGDFTRLKNATFSLFHLSRRQARKCVFENHTLRLPDAESVNEELERHIGSYLKIF